MRQMLPRSDKPFATLLGSLTPQGGEGSLVEVQEKTGRSSPRNSRARPERKHTITSVVGASDGHAGRSEEADERH